MKDGTFINNLETDYGPKKIWKIEYSNCKNKKKNKLKFK